MIKNSPMDWQYKSVSQAHSYKAMPQRVSRIVYFWNFAKSSGATVKLHFHSPIAVKEGDNRKSLAYICEQTVAESLENSALMAA